MRTRPLLFALVAAGAGAVAGALRARSVIRAGGEELLWAEADEADWVPSSIGGAAVVGDAPDDSARRAEARADAVAAARRAGHPAQRGREGSVGFDLGRLPSEGRDLEPVVQYLTYIQSRRGSDSSLLFIRYDDIDAMADLDGEASEDLLERLDQLGVVVSAN